MTAAQRRFRCASCGQHADPVPDAWADRLRDLAAAWGWEVRADGTLRCGPCWSWDYESIDHIEEKA